MTAEPVKCEDCRFAIQCYAGKFSMVLSSTAFYATLCPDCERMVVSGHCFEGPECDEQTEYFKCAMRWMTRKYRDEWADRGRYQPWIKVADTGPGSILILQRCYECNSLLPSSRDPLLGIVTKDSIKR